MANMDNLSLNQISFQINKTEVKNHDIVFKTILIGPPSVGKSCLLLRYLNDSFNDKHEVTIGLEFGKVMAKINNKDVKIDIWDTAGTEKFRSVVKTFFKGTHCIFLVFDIVETKSLEELNYFLNDIRQNADLNPNIVLVGNKCDKKNSKSIQTEEIQKYAEENNLDLYFEVSAKTSEGVNELFEQSIKLCFLKHENRRKSEILDRKKYEDEMKIRNSPNKGKNCNC